MHSTPNQDKTDVLLLHPPFSVTYLSHWSQGQLSKQICSGLPLPNHLPNSSNGPSGGSSFLPAGCMERSCAVAEAKMLMWEEFIETMVQNF